MKIQLCTLLWSTLLVSHLALANVENGEFENWSNGSPDSWSTIDSGISVNQSTNVIKSGSNSAAITVNTGSQASTDFRQSVSVSAGQNIDFSVWVYHTEGNLRARLYVDGYRVYSDQNIVNQWQQISYNYTASSAGSIQVGLRFYDVSGFDGSEVVYVDDFQPNTGAGGGSGSGCQTNSGSFSLTTDNYGSETSWSLSRSGSGVVASGSGYASNQSYQEDLCVEDGDYTFTINDTYGDGICCQYGSGSYNLVLGGSSVANGGNFNSTESTSFSLGGSGGGSGGGSSGLTGYYASANGLSGYALKSALYDIIKTHTSQGYGALWGFYSANEIDNYYENDGSILDIYSERPSSNDPFTFSAVSDQCGNYSGEGDCYNREHSFPRSWFGGTVEPMNSDVHHIFATDGKVNSVRSSFPYGEVGSASYTSQNGSLLGSAQSGLGYSGTVFEPIDEFKGDIARAYFYMATRYENVIGNWENNSSYSDAVLIGNSTQVFESWFLSMLKTWHQQDPVSQKEVNRNDAAQPYQGNRNPFVDHPELVTEIWGN